MAHTLAAIGVRHRAIRAGEMIQAFRSQLDVLTALVIHDLSGKMRSFNYGYVWLILEPAIYIAFIRLLKQVFSAFAPPNGMTPLTFYTLGVMVTFMAFDVIGVVNRSSGST